MESAVRFDGYYKPHTTITLNENLENGKIKPVSNSDHTLKRIGEVALAVLACIFVFITAGCALFWEKIEQVIWQGFSPNFDSNNSGSITKHPHPSATQRENFTSKIPTREEFLEKLILENYQPESEGEVEGVYYYPLPSKEEGVDRPGHFVINSHPNIFFETDEYVDMKFEGLDKTLKFLQKNSIDISNLPKLYLVKNEHSIPHSYFIAYVFENGFNVRKNATKIYDECRVKFPDENIAEAELYEFKNYMENQFYEKEKQFINELIKSNIVKLQKGESVNGILYHESRNKNRIKFSIPEYDNAKSLHRTTFFETPKHGRIEDLKTDYSTFSNCHSIFNEKCDHIDFRIPSIPQNGLYVTTVSRYNKLGEIDEDVYREQICDTIKQLIELCIKGYTGFRKEDLYQDTDILNSGSNTQIKKKLKISVSDYSLVTQNQSEILIALENIYNAFEGEKRIQQFIVQESLKHEYCIISLD